ncbi:MAG: radical SAM protein [Candidatus Edwardsbacteria bacterium]
MKINSIFKSIQGESTYAGLPCIFVRVGECNLRCTYCDTKYAYKKWKEIPLGSIVNKIKNFDCPLIEITGGEPLLQEEIYELIEFLKQSKYKILLETNGSLNVERVDSSVVKIIDLKCPSSGMNDKIFWRNLKKITPKDQIKFVMATQEDYEWARKVIEERSLVKTATVLFAPVFGRLHPQKLADWILEDNLNVRLQLQIQKYIWGTRKKNV